jgi:alcohol oxidase
MVTEHLLDHNLTFPPYLASEDADTLDVIFREKEAQLERMAVFAETEYMWLILQPSIRFSVASKWQGSDGP